MNVVLSVRFDARTARRINEIAHTTGRTPGRLIRDWTLERIGSLSGVSPGAEPIAAGIREAPTAYEAEADPYEGLRQRYRPARIDILMVGESQPAGGTFFYLANSNLYYATQQAFQLAFGPMPEGEDFFDVLRNRGVWLYDVADAPVDRTRGRPRREAVQARISDLVDVLRQDQPRVVVVIKKDLAPTVRKAVEDAGIGADRLRVLPFPLYQWRAEYIRGLAALIGDEAGLRPASSTGESAREAEPGPMPGSPQLPSARALVGGLVGKELQTLTGAPNRILRLVGDRAIVATDRSRQGRPVPLREVQAALDALAESGDLQINVPTVGHRSAFIGAVLRTLPGVVASTRPRRIRLVPERLARYRAALGASFGVAAHLPDGASYVDEVRGGDLLRQRELDERAGE
jgi:hypothetical protein